MVCGILYCPSAWAQDYVVYEGPFLDDSREADVLAGYDDFDEWTEATEKLWGLETDEGVGWVATDSEATPSTASQADRVAIAPMSSYGSPYDGSISSSVLTYFKGMVEKLPPDVHYVLFRSSQYEYRLVYGSGLELSGNRFSGSGMKYITYETRYSTMSNGNEGNFSLTVGSYLVYSDLGDYYPVLVEGVKSYEFKALLFVAVVALLLVFYKAFFSPGRITV